MTGYSDDILVGHSMENDLRVLQIMHSRIIDTGMHVISSSSL
jgi:hypothetical protein